jgi:anti-sigma regulatory factor (Ser/Thr protein kinase)
VTEKKGLGPAHFAVHLPYDRTAAAAARLLLSELLARHDVRDELVGDATLVLHELVVNGLVHGEPDERNEIEVSAYLAEDRLVVSVADRGNGGMVAPQPFTSSGVDGRGLAMVAVLSEAWSVDRSVGTRVSAELSL